MSNLQLDLTAKFTDSKMVQVRNRKVFNKLKGATAEKVLTEYYNSQLKEGYMFTSLDLLTLAVEGNLIYDGDITQQVLIDLSNRHLRTGMHVELSDTPNVFTDSELNSLAVFKKLKDKKPSNVFEKDTTINIIHDTETRFHTFAFDSIPDVFFPNQPYVLRHSQVLKKDVEYKWLALVKCGVCDKVWLEPVYQDMGLLPAQKSIVVDCCANIVRVHAWINPLKTFNFLQDLADEEAGELYG